MHHVLGNEHMTIYSFMICSKQEKRVVQQTLKIVTAFCSIPMLYLLCHSQALKLELVVRLNTFWHYLQLVVKYSLVSYLSMVPACIAAFCEG